MNMPLISNAHHNPHNLMKLRSDALRQSCQHMPCTLRISSMVPGHKCSAQETVIGAHMPAFGKGVNTKVSDLFIAAACFNCHELLDGRDPRYEWLAHKYPAAVEERCRMASYETLTLWAQMGLLAIPDGEWI